MSQIGPSPAGIYWNKNFSALFLLPRVSSVSLGGPLVVLFSLSFLSRSPSHPLARTITPKSSQFLSHLPLTADRVAALYAPLRWLLSSPGCSRLFSLGLSPTAVGADLPTRCIITGQVWVSETFVRMTLLGLDVTDVAFSCLSSFPVTFSSSTKNLPLRVLLWGWINARWDHFNPWRGDGMGHWNA